LDFPRDIYGTFLSFPPISGNFDLATRLEIISDVVSERHVAEKFRYHIGNTDVVSEKTDVVSVFPMWYRYFRCGIGIFLLRAFSDTTSEIIPNRVSLTFQKIMIATENSNFPPKKIALQG
jgi:hypothetical protein